ncbi:MAG: amidohydrolase [Candidatus Scalindua rubra]|uniref:Amidohydrolase n=1 Tax=Candidatus Scalindua brodae TaxID=237368 RepID=A0A0B0ELN2_9BACT|nr:MAG: amidohydrolase [Candidatus Scalindua brodae]MBZ0107719.1 amidohydrolase [Candidatus Scalindua rubra]TWU35523.1 putative hydrolase YxeP [Candidatus Brocadiaceae bacterium S225]
MRDTIHNEVRKIIEKAIDLRHRFHEIPERSFEENKTSRLIAQELQQMGLDVEEGIAGTGVAANIKGGLHGNTIALRADMDALNIEEETSKPYASRHKGLSHSCGHDGHIVCLLEAARILVKLREQLAGTVRVIFQPGEENGTGAQAMIDAGALGSPLPAAIFALHAWPYLESGVVASKPGNITAAIDYFSITVKGKGGHGARPHESTNPIISASHIVQEISALTNKGDNGKDPCVVSVGIIQGGTQPNTIPDHASIEGTIRSLNETNRRKTLETFNKTVKEIGIQQNVQVAIDFIKYGPPVNNNPDLYHLFEKVCTDLLVPEKRAYIKQQSMGSEDFGNYTQLIPGLLIRLGMGESSPPLHTGRFDFCDKSLDAGITILVGLAMKATETNLLFWSTVTRSLL